MKNIKIPINTNFAVINEKPLCKIIPNIMNDTPAVSIIPAACIREKTSGNLIRPIDPVNIKKTPAIKDIIDIISIEISNIYLSPSVPVSKSFKTATVPIKFMSA